MPSKRKPGSAVRKSSPGIGHRDATEDPVRKARRETIGAVAAVLDHESRNLLGALNTCVTMLRRNPQITQDDRELLDMIQSGSRRLQEIVSAFGTFANPGPPRFEPVHVHALIDETLRLLEHDERWSNELVMRREFDPEVNAVRGDRDQLTQVLWHLFLNAAQAMEGRGRLEVETGRRGGYVRIVVRDTGPGIPATVLPCVFEPLYTTKSRGTGLGLAIVQQIITSHGGEVLAESGREGGCAFAVTLPAEPNET